MLPPLRPCFPLPNYILTLRDDIKIVGTSYLLHTWHKNNFTTFHSAAKKFGISESFYRMFVTGIVPIPIWALKLLCQFDPKLISQIRSQHIVFTARTQKDNLPTYMTPQLAYYIGYLHGDGHIDKNRKRITFTDENKGQLQIIDALTKRLFNVAGHFKKTNFGRGSHVFEVRRVTINSFFSDVLRINRGKRKHNTIPEIIKQNKELLRWYICGLFDAEGAMPLFPKKKNVYIDMAMTDIKLINGVGKILENLFDIGSYGPYKRLTHHPSGNTTLSSELRIRKHSEIVKYLNTISTLHPDKIRRKELMLKILHP